MYGFESKCILIENYTYLYLKYTVMKMDVIFKRFSLKSVSNFITQFDIHQPQKYLLNKVYENKIFSLNIHPMKLLIMLLMVVH